MADVVKKKILLAGHVQITCDSMKNCLEMFLGDYVDVVTWCVGDTVTPPTALREADLAIVVTKPVYDLCRAACPPSTPLMVAERVISVQHLDKLLGLEEQGSAYVVGTNYETTMNTVGLLRGLGFGQSFVPCYIGMTDQIRTDIDVAITPGLLQLVPPHVTTIIDVGAKEVAISSLAEIMRLLDIPTTELNNISNFYIKTILMNTRESTYVGMQNQALNNRLEVMLNILQEAIVAIDERKRVVVYNQASEKIFHLPVEKAIGSDWSNVAPESILIENLESGEGVNRFIKFINGYHYLVNSNVIRDHDSHIRGVVATFHPVQEIQELETQVRRELRTKVNVARYTFSDIQGASPELQKSVSLASKFAGTDLTVLLNGESGTGKELFAQAIHNYSPRRNNPFVAINFAAIPDNLVESELFGYEEGAFSGARKGGKAGLFEEAHLGTIFLDEIGNATPDVQNRLLRVLEEKEIRRLGSGRNTPVDVRVIAATNVDLETLVNAKTFRADLYYRLCTLPIVIPSLRSRRSDIPRLARHFANRHGKNLEFSEAVMEVFLRYDWPGNLRELQNAVQYLCSVVAPEHAATVEDLPPHLLSKVRAQAAPEPEAAGVEDPFPQMLQNMYKPDVRQGIIALLMEINRCSSELRGVGASTLTKAVGAHMPGVTRYYIKKWTRELKSMGCVASGKTKQGTFITDKGVAFLRALQERKSLSG